MPIRHYLQGQGVAFEMALVTLQHADGPVAPTRDAVAQKIIELAKAGERDPERLCDGALKATMLISDPSEAEPGAIAWRRRPRPRGRRGALLDPILFRLPPDCRSRRVIELKPIWRSIRQDRTLR